MTLENTFYTLGIIVMSISLILMFCLLFLVFFIMRKVNQMHDMANNITSSLKEISNNPTGAALNIGAQITKSAFKRFTSGK